MADRTFSTAYAADKSFAMVWMPLLSACVLGMAGLFMNEFALTIMSAALTAMAAFNWPLIDQARVVLRLTDDGVDIDGIGHLPWNVIQSASLHRARAAKQRPQAILIDLKLPYTECAHPMPAMDRPAWHRKLGRTPTKKRIAIPLTGLFDPPEDIAAAFEAFLGEKFSRALA